jgi:hypothetical protein
MLKKVYYLGLFTAIFSIFFFPSLLYAQSTPWSFYNNPLQSNSMDIFYNGVGAVNPALRIKSNGEFKVNGALGANSGATFQHFNGTQGVTIGYMGIGKMTTNGNNNLNIDAVSNGSLLLNANGGTGNVGIGTTTPPANLTIKQTNDSQGTGGIRSYNAGGLSSLALLQGGDHYSYLGNMGPGGIRFYSNNFGTLAMNIDTAGNLGLGTSTPTQKLEVIGNISANLLYDRENPAYNIDPAGYSTTWVLRRLYGFNGPEYDENNGAYYVDPGNTTKLNNLRVDSIDCFSVCNSINGFLRYTGNIHLNTAQNYGLYVNWDNAPNAAPSSILPFNVGNGANGHLFYVRGDGYVWTIGQFAAAGVWYSSDERLKKNIQPIPNALEKVMALNGVNFRWDRSKYPERTANLPERLQLGFVAQQVEKAVPEVVEEDKDGFKQVSYGNLTALLVEGVKDQQKQLETIKKITEKDQETADVQQQEIELLKQQIIMLKSEIELLKEGNSTRN